MLKAKVVDEDGESHYKGGVEHYHDYDNVDSPTNDSG